MGNDNSLAVEVGRLAPSQGARLASLCQEKGFALVSLLILAPLLMSVAVAVGGALYVMKKKTLLQSLCVQSASRLQEELKQTLDQLLALNPQALRLQKQRRSADRGLQRAMATGNPYAITVARAYQAFVIAQQAALRGRQEALLARAEGRRRRSHRELKNQIRLWRTDRFTSERYFPRALAVRPQPVSSLSPEYLPVSAFAHWQQHRFRFRNDLSPPFLNLLPAKIFKQTTECSVSLKGKENQWHLELLAASAQSKRF